MCTDDLARKMWVFQMKVYVSKEELCVMIHAQGIKSKTPMFRNYFCATPESNCDYIWSSLVGKGVAVLCRVPNEIYNYNMYCVKMVK